MKSLRWLVFVGVLAVSPFLVTIAASHRISNVFGSVQTPNTSARTSTVGERKDKPRDIRMTADVSEPLPGDIVVYTLKGVIVHSGVITRVDTDRRTVREIESQWGNLGLYRHNPDDIPSIHYGTWVAYHTDRGSNQLKQTSSLRTGSRNPLEFQTDRGHTISPIHPETETQKPSVTAIKHMIGSCLYPKLHRVGSSTSSFNCHGYTFAGRTCWISSKEVPRILKDNGYYPLAGARHPGSTAPVCAPDGSALFPGESRHE